MVPDLYYVVVSFVETIALVVLYFVYLPVRTEDTEEEEVRAGGAGPRR